MAECTGCGKKFGYFEDTYGSSSDLCWKCHRQEEKMLDNAPPATAKQQRTTDEYMIKQLSRQIEAITLTTETAPNLKITKRIEIVTAECAFGMNIFKDLFAGVRDIVGGRSEAVQKTMRDSRKTVLYELKKEAYEVGANAVVGVDLDYVELSSAGSMVMLVASGTAVVIDGENE